MKITFKEVPQAGEKGVTALIKALRGDSSWVPTSAENLEDVEIDLSYFNREIEDALVYDSNILSFEF